MCIQDQVVNVMCQRCTFCEASLPSGGLAEDGGAANTQHNSLGVTEYSGDLVAAWKRRQMTAIRIGGLLQQHQSYSSVEQLFVL